MRTDWDTRADDEDAFLNADENGPHSPGPTVGLHRVSAVGKGIVGWGTECIGTDAGQAGGMEPPFPAHNLLHKDNRYGLASLANLDKLPPKGAILIAAPLKIAQRHRQPDPRAGAGPEGLTRWPGRWRLRSRHRRQRHQRAGRRGAAGARRGNRVLVLERERSRRRLHADRRDHRCRASCTT